MGISIIDTHAHLYAEEFDNDREAMLLRAKEAGVEKVILPNVDSASLPRMLELEKAHPEFCYAAIGLHPTSINNTFYDELRIVEEELKRRKYIAIGEIGTDLYWDKTYLKEQQEAFARQLQWSIDYQLPVIIHVRDSFDETFQVMRQFEPGSLKGIFHSFSGTVEQAHTIQEYGTFYLGINGISTFKNSGMAEVLVRLRPEWLVLETDSPYLAPVPYRGKRNESSYIKQVTMRLAEIFRITEEEIAAITTKNAKSLFNMI
jgi:TatD DNase family protein